MEPSIWVNGRMVKNMVKEHSLMEKGNGKETSMKENFSYYCTVKLHVSDAALPPLGSEATTFQ